MQQQLLEHNSADDVETHNARQRLVESMSIADLEKQHLGTMTAAKWESVGKLVNAKVPKGKQKTPRQCMTQYLTREAKGVNHGAWTPDEEERLVGIVQSHKESNWEQVAKELGTGRLVIDCLRRYQTKHNKSLKRTVWTKEEDR
jgi:hypothetical protein